MKPKKTAPKKHGAAAIRPRRRQLTSELEFAMLAAPCAAICWNNRVIAYLEAPQNMPHGEAMIAGLARALATACKGKFSA